MRVGDAVRLHWATPTQTTDKLAIKGPIVAEICRDVVAATSTARLSNTPCHATTRVNVATGGSDAVDALPATLTSGPARLLSYRVQLLNAAGRTAGPSPAVFAVAGETPRPVEEFSGSTTKAGILLRWRVEAAGVGGNVQRVELDRAALDSPSGAGSAGAAGKVRRSGVPGLQRQTVETRFQAGAKDAGGTLDRTAEMGRSYSYTAQRVDVVVLAGQALELRSAPSKALAFAVRDEFPPDVPAGLVAVPGLSGEDEAQKPTIDLSWEPQVEARLAGYRVYRRDVGAEVSGAWVRLDAQLLTTAAYRDLTVVAGHRYAYRLTAVSTAGYESAPSAEATETARATP